MSWRGIPFMILFGHPTGNPNSHHAALAHFDAGRLDAFCVPWMPTELELAVLGALPGCGQLVARLRRRRFEPLAAAPKIEGRLGEWKRLVQRVIANGIEERLAYEANDWLMATMSRACTRANVSAVHAYEDCSLSQFEHARQLGKACIYDLPIGYYPAWEETQRQLERRYADWLTPTVMSDRFARPEQKRREMKLADVVLVPSEFVRRTVDASEVKATALAPYGVDLDFWSPGAGRAGASGGAPLRFIYAGRCSVRKGIPLLLDAWAHANVSDAELILVGSWGLAASKMTALPKGVRALGAMSSEGLRDQYRGADVFVFPSFFEGFGLVLLEAMACGLPAIATDATAGPEVLDAASGRVIPAGDVDQLVEAIRWFAVHRDALPEMKRASRAAAERCTWKRYREAVTTAVAPYC